MKVINSCDFYHTQRMQLDRALLHDSKRQTYDQTKKCAETLLLLGQVSDTVYRCTKAYTCTFVYVSKLDVSHSLPLLPTNTCTQTDRAVQLLLETDSSNSDYYTDALK